LARKGDLLIADVELAPPRPDAIFERIRRHVWLPLRCLNVSTLRTDNSEGNSTRASVEPQRSEIQVVVQSEFRSLGAWGWRAPRTRGRRTPRLARVCGLTSFDHRHPEIKPTHYPNSLTIVQFAGILLRILREPAAKLSPMPTTSRRRWFQVSVAEYLFLTTLLGVVWWQCARWPVVETSPVEVASDLPGPVPSVSTR